ncbi:MAG: glycosyltransferase family A protein, partial [Verrucomicrobiota bacterium]
MASPPENPLVSVIVPAFNAESKLPAALDSVLAQTEVSWECLVIDDGSTDGTAGIVRNYEAKDSRFRLIQQENLGVGAARNSGLAQAKGEFIAPLDADDRWLPEKLEKQVKRMEEEGPDCGLVYCWSNRIDDQGAFMWRCRPFEAEGEVFDALLMWNFVGNASVPLYRASVLAGIRPYLTRVEQGGVQGCEDWELSLRMADC